MTFRTVPLAENSTAKAPHAEDNSNTHTVMRRIPEKIVKPWALPPQTKYVFTNANIVDPIAGNIIPGATVKLAGGLIKSITTNKSTSVLAAAAVAATDADEDKEVVIVDVRGKYLCPGLIDCHVHLTSVPGEATLSGVFNASSADAGVSYLRQPYVVRQCLRRGFTSVRDCGGASLALKEAVAEGVFAGPRLFIAGRALSQTGGHGDRRGPHDHDACPSSLGEEGLSVVCDGVSECVRAAREQLRTGADFLKIHVGGGVASPTDRLSHVQFRAAEVAAVSEVADAYGTWVTAHAYTPAAIRHAVENGVRGVEHGNFLDAATARYMAERGVWLTPTLVTYSAMASGKYAGFLPDANRRKNEEVLARGLESLEIARAAGVKMCFGSDLLGPMTAEESGEFAIRRKVLSDLEILRAATVNGAEMLRQEDFLGQIKENFAADLLVLNANPLDDVTILGRPENHVLAVLKDGRVYDSRWSKLPQDVEEQTQLLE